MPALPKPHRIAFLEPVVDIDGPDAAYEREAAVLVWTACIETCQRHPRLAVYDADATPLLPQDGHFSPQNAGRGARPDDTFFGPSRRDELIWLELAVGSRPGIVRLHAIARDGRRESFEALGRNVGEQIHQVLNAWLGARGLGGLPRRFEPITSEELLAVVRVIAPTLAEQARAWSLPVAASPTWSLAVVPDDDVGDEHDVDELDVLDEAPAGEVLESTIDSTLDLDPGASGVTDSARRAFIARPLANRLPQAFRVPALRVLELALREDLTDLVLAADREHPHALFADFERLAPHGRNFALLRKVIALAPALARPYEALRDDDEQGGRDAPTPLETVGAVGIAALCRPGNLDVLDTAATILDSDRRTDEGLRLLERAVALHDDSPRSHLALLDLHKQSGRLGAWFERSMRSASQHGCPMDPDLPWYPDQIHIDLRASTALLNVGRLGEAIALRANRLDGRETTWPAHQRVLEAWRKEPRFVAWCYAREGYLRGDEARTVEGFWRIEPDDEVDLAMFLDALVALGREDEAPFAWAQFGLGRGFAGPVSRLAAARALMAAGDWRRGIEELWRVELTEPGRDDHVALARALLVMSTAPIDVIEAALGERVAVGAPSLARRMARDAADFVPIAAKSGIVARALGKTTLVEFDASWLSGFAADTPSRRAIDALFAELGPLRKGPPSGFDIADELKRGDRLVNRWLEVAFTEASEDDPAALAPACAYIAAQALARYFAATTSPPTTIAGALRTVAGEALALVRRHRTALSDRDARAVLAAIEPLLRRIDRWVGHTWLATVERSLGLDERAGGDVAGFARDFPTVAARILGPEETAVLTWSVAKLHRDRETGWAAKVAAQAAQLVRQTGSSGVDELADAIAAQLAAREIEVDDAIDALHTACYLAEDRSAIPAAHLARVLFAQGRAPAALVVLSTGMRAAPRAWRDAQVPWLVEAWQTSKLDVPLETDRAATAMYEALQQGEPARAEKLGRWVVALDPDNAEAHRNLGLAFAHQGKLIEALHHLVRASRDQATQILAGVLYQAGKLPEALAVLDYASRWYARADQWLTYGGIAFAAMDNARTAKAYSFAYQLDPDEFDASQLNAYAAVLDELGDHATCEAISQHLVRVVGDDVMWKTNAWNHLACAAIGLGKFDEAIELAERASRENPLPDNGPAFASTLARARARQQPAPPAPPVAKGKPREPVFAMLEAGDHAGAADQRRAPTWRVRRAALHATRFRFASENHLDVTTRARAAAVAVLGDTTGSMDREAVLSRALALQIREQAYFARDPVPRLGDRMTREAFYQEFRQRGGSVLGKDVAPAAPFVDRVIVPGSKVARASDYIALLRDLAALAPKDALAQFDLDEPGYLEVARAWADAMAQDASIVATINAGLAQR